METDIAIARSVALRPIAAIAESLHIPDDAIEPYGRYKAKISLEWLNARKSSPNGKLILVTAINPT
ncbi:MAG: formate--tetrahydrofolate ligase, partial [Sphingomonas sp.]